jgi:feruloyl-CoA synthase
LTFRNADLMNALREVLTRMAKKSTGSSTLIKRAMITDFSLSLDKGEITDKGTINQRTILDNHPEAVEKMYLQKVQKGIVEAE